MKHSDFPVRYVNVYQGFAIHPGLTYDQGQHPVSNPGTVRRRKGLRYASPPQCLESWENREEPESKP